MKTFIYLPFILFCNLQALKVITNVKNQMLNKTEYSVQRLNIHSLSYLSLSWLHFKHFFKNYYLLHAKLDSHYEAWSYKKKKHKKVKANQKSAQKEPTVRRFLLILNLKPLRSQVKGKHSVGRQFQSLAVRGKKLFTQTSL